MFDLELVWVNSARFNSINQFYVTTLYSALHKSNFNESGDMYNEIRDVILREAENESTSMLALTGRNRDKIKMGWKLSIE